MVSRAAWSTTLLVLALGGCHLVFDFEREPEPPPVPGEWATVTTGVAHSCAIQTDGSLWCWGENANRQLGLGDATDVEIRTPQRVGADSWISIGGGLVHTCGLRDTGTLWCWGYNGFGSVGDGTRTQRAEPVQIGADHWKVLAVGDNSTCAIRDDDSLWCWGYNPYGNLGDGTTSERAEPTLIDGSKTWTSVSLATTHTCALTDDHQLWCWGYAPLGGGGLTSELTPVRVEAGTEWTAIATTIGATCGITDGQVLCWGLNELAQLGDGTQVDRGAATPIASSRTDFVQLAARWKTACAIAADGTMECWGENRRGQIGSDTAQPIQTTPHEMEDAWKTVAPHALHSCGIDGSSHLHCTGGNSSGQRGDGTGGSVLEPVMVEGSWSSVAAGEATTCGLSGSKLYCWGDNAGGQLGDGTVFSRQVPALTMMVNPSSKLAIGGHHVCSTDTGGQMYCWGENRERQLPSSTEPMVPRPIPVFYPAVAAGTIAVAAYEHSCAIGSDSKAYCWGRNASGQLGRNSIGPFTPMIAAVVDANTAMPLFTALTAGTAHTCGIANGTYVYCWGQNARGQLGVNSTTSSSVATSVFATAAKIDAGSEHTCAINAANQLSCWGNNTSGQLGDGTTVAMRVAPAIVPGNWSSVSAGAEHTCGIRTDGSLWCWGGNNRGALGNGTYTATNAPVTRLGTAQWLSVSAGAGYTCGVQMNGTLWCWGSPQAGQLGDGKAWTTRFAKIELP
jgi:alpha-tubulin suppressor-like RCC1 family protein